MNSPSTKASPSTKPYLIRALFDWCVDNSFTPYIVVQVDKNTRVPMAYVREGQIVLNIAPYATNQLSITNEDITCQARFNGAAQSLYVPVSNVIAIYSRETGQGMAFELGMQSGTAMELGGTIEADENDDEDMEGDDVARQEISPVSDASAESDREPDPDPDPVAPSPKPSHLRVVK